MARKERISSRAMELIRSFRELQAKVETRLALMAYEVLRELEPLIAEVNSAYEKAKEAETTLLSREGTTPQELSELSDARFDLLQLLESLKRVASPFIDVLERRLMKLRAMGVH